MHSISLLGSLNIKADGQPSGLLKSSKGCALVLYLLITRQRQTRELLADLLWENANPTQGLGNLRTLLVRIRHLVPGLAITRTHLAFQPVPDTSIDLYALTTGLESNEPARLDTALQLYRAPLLHNFYLENSTRFNEWLVVEREHLRQRVLDAYHKLFTIYAEQNEWAKGIEAARRCLIVDTYNEEANYRLLEFLSASGQDRAALVHYQIYKQTVADEYGIQPEAKIAELHERIRASERNRYEAIQPESPTHFDWGAVPGVTSFFGRMEQLQHLENWLVGERVRLVSLLGMGGQGKTTLAAMLAYLLAERFEGVIWRSLLNAPPLPNLLCDYLSYFSGKQVVDLAEGLAGGLAQLERHLRSGRFLLVLDNVESILDETNAGEYRIGYENYAKLMGLFAQGAHQSCLLLTGREHPWGLERMERDSEAVRSLMLPGLPETDGVSMLEAAGLRGDEDELSRLVARYSGNPLALKLVAQAIQDFYLGDINAFLQEETPIFEDIRKVLDEQIKRLRPLEKEILTWLAILREPVSVDALRENLLKPPRQRKLLEALYNLQKRSLLEKSAPGFSLQNVIIEYLSEELIDQLIAELKGEHFNWLNRFALQGARNRVYVRDIQARLFLQPAADFLRSQYATDTLDKKFKRMFNALRARGKRRPGYAAANLLNLMIFLSLDMTGYDLSDLCIWQANLQNASLPAVDFSGSDLTGSQFSEQFGSIYSVAFSPKDSLLAAGGADGCVHFWRQETGQLILSIKAHTEPIFTVAFSPDGASLASGSADGTIRIWDVHTGELRKVLKGHPAGVLALAFSPSGNVLASSGEASRVYLWDLENALWLHILRAHTDQVVAVAFSPNGRILASASRDKTICLWRLEELVEPEIEQAWQVLREHTDWVNSLAFNPDGSTLASASADQSICLWDVVTGQVRTKLTGHSAGVQSIAFSPDGKTLASGGDDFSVRLWQFETGNIQHAMYGHTNWVYSVAFSRDGKTLASGSWDRTVRLWDVQNGYGLRTFQGHMKWAFGMAFSPEGKILASATSDTKIRLWDVRTGVVIKTLHGHRDWVWALEFHPQGQWLVSTSMDRSLRIWDIESGECLATLVEHHDGVQGLAVSPKGTLVAGGGLDQVTILWDVSRVRETGQVRIINKLHGHSGWCLGAAFSPDGLILATCSADHTIRLWDVHSGECLQVLEGHIDGVQQVIFSPDRKTLASGSWDKSIGIWDVSSGKLLHRLEGHTNIIRSIAFSSDGNLLASGGNDQVLRLWNVQSGTIQRELVSHTNWIFSTRFSPDDQTVVSASGDETIKFWDVRTGNLKHTLTIPGPYEGMNIAGITFLTEAQKKSLLALGAKD